MVEADIVDHTDRLHKDRKKLVKVVISVGGRRNDRKRADWGSGVL